MHDPVIRPFFCAENTTIANIYLDMWHFFFPQIDGTEQKDKDGALLYLGHEVQNALNFVFPNGGKEEANAVAPMISRSLQWIFFCGDLQ